jgi:hypothetical protein
LVAAAPATEQVRYARPEQTPASSLPIDVGQGTTAGLGGLMVLGGLVSFGIGIVLLKRT